MAGKTRVMRSPITGQPAVYYEHSALMTCQQAAPVPPESLMTLMNSELTAQGIDAFADKVKIIQGWADTNIEAHLWIKGDSPVGAFLALSILAIVVGAVAIIYIISSTAQTIIEHFWPKSQFYQVDVNGNPIVVGSLAEYITCQRATHPEGFVCGYCGQVFSTPELRDAHQETCPWKEGVPGEPPPYTGIIIIILGASVVIGGIWVLGKILGREKGPPILVVR